MSYKPHNNEDPLSGWDFTEPDWLNELYTEKSAAQADPITNPVSKKTLPDTTGRQSPPSARRETDWQRDPAPGKAPTSPQKPRRHNDHTWEQTRSNRGRSPTRSRRGRKPSASAPVIILIILLLGGMIFAGWQLGSIFLNYNRDRSAYEDLASRAISGLAEPEDATVPVSTTDPESIPEPTPVSEIPFTVDWDYLSSINDDIVGWLYCPDTVINYPVVQNDDHDFYLDHGFDGASNTTGTLFVDRASVCGIDQSNYIIYGHNMKDNSMFGTFKNYAEESYYEAHPTLYYLTPDQCYRVDLICAHIVEATEENFPGYFANTDDYQSYLNRISSSAFWVNSDAITTEHQLLTMSTCTSASGYRDPRLLVQGMMVPIQ